MDYKFYNSLQFLWCDVRVLDNAKGKPAYGMPGGYGDDPDTESC